MSTQGNKNPEAQPGSRGTGQSPENQQNSRTTTGQSPESQPNRKTATGSREKSPFGVTQNKFWDFVPGTATKPPELLLYGTISSQQSWWEDRVTPAQFNRELAALGEDVPEIVVRINSPGGDVFAANAIYTRLKDHGAKITVKVDGWAASAATIIAMAGDTIKIPRNGVFMIHDPAMTVWDTFRAEDFEKMAQELKVIKQSIINAYSVKTGKTADEISGFMSDETWWTGDEAVENGFCDELMFEEAQTVIENAGRIIVNSVPIDMGNFKTVPKMLLNSPAATPGGLQNGRQPENKPKKEEKKMEPKDAITTIEALKAAYPDLTATIEDNARKEERNRIKALEGAAVGGFESIVHDAKFVNPISAGEMALQIVMEQKKQGGAYLQNREEDVTDSHVSDVGTGASEKGGEGKDPFNEAIDRLFPDVK